MPRFTFGGDIHDLIVAPDAATNGALKVAPNVPVSLYTTATEGAPTTDFLVGGVAATAVTSLATGYLPEFQGPDGVSILYYDPDPNDADVSRVRFVARDAASGGIAAATTTAAGIVELATESEASDGSSTTLVVTPAGAKAVRSAHESAADPHSQYNQAAVATAIGTTGNAVRDAVLTLTNPKQSRSVLSTKGDLYVATGAGAVTRQPVGTDGQVLVADAAQANGMRWAAPSAGLTGFDLEVGSDLSNASTTFSSVTGLDVTTMSTGVYYVTYVIPYEASTTGAITIRFRAGTGLVTATTFRIVGRWQGPNTIASPSNGSSGKFEPIRYPAKASLGGTFGGVGIGVDSDVIGDFKVTVAAGVTGATLQPEFAQNAADTANATRIFAGAWGTVLKVA